MEQDPGDEHVERPEWTRWRVVQGQVVSFYQRSWFDRIPTQPDHDPGDEQVMFEPPLLFCDLRDYKIVNA